VKPLFTVHAGEFLVGCEIEKRFPNVNLWLPAKDTGIDLLVSNKDNKKTISLQVKFSRDYLVTHLQDFRNSLRACGWWKATRQQLKTSRAQYWVFVLLGLARNIEFIIIKPDVLLNRLESIHGKTVDTFQSYLWVTQEGKCFETRGLNRSNQQLIADGAFKDDSRDFTAYLNNNWTPIKALNE